MNECRGATYTRTFCHGDAVGVLALPHDDLGTVDCGKPFPGQYLPPMISWVQCAGILQMKQSLGQSQRMTTLGHFERPRRPRLDLICIVLWYRVSHGLSQMKSACETWTTKRNGRGTLWNCFSRHRNSSLICPPPVCRVLYAGKRIFILTPFGTLHEHGPLSRVTHGATIFFLAIWNTYLLRSQLA